ncbi:hypothetical protein K8S19_11965 [bacterium]|nr:hypothetical protein [bacterium]
MKTIKQLRGFIAGVVILLSAQAVVAAPVLVHQPVMQGDENKSVVLQVTLTDSASKITEVQLFYRTAGTLGYRSDRMVSAGVTFTGTIPARMMLAPGVEYYIQAKNQVNETTTSPPLNAAAAPHRIVVRDATLAPKLRLLMPEDGSTIPPSENMIVIRIDSGKSRTDLASLKVILDEKDITVQVKQSDTMLTYVSDTPLASGLHGLKVTVRNAEGMESVSPTWSFTIDPKKEGAAWKADIEKLKEGEFVFKGNIDLESQHASLSTEPTDKNYLAQPEGWLNRLRVNFSGQSENYGVIGSAYVTSEETPGRQPVNRFRTDFFSPILDLTLGDFYPVFTDYTISNPFVRGAYMRLILGNKFQGHSELILLGGWNQMAIEGLTGTGGIDSKPGTFERYLAGFRWITDFMPDNGFSINVGGVYDNPESLDEETTAGGTLDEANATVTADLHLKIDYTSELYSTFYGEYAVSFHGYGVDYFSYSGAIDTYRAGSLWKWNNLSFVSLEYKHTGANYVTLANPWLVSDWQGISADAQIHLVDNTLMLMGDVDIWQDNLNGQKDTWEDSIGNSLTATTDTMYVSGMISYRLPPYLSTINIGYSINRQKDRSEITSLDNQTNVLNLGLGSQIPISTGDQILANISYTMSQFQDETGFLSDNSSSSLLTSVMYLRGVLFSFSGSLGFNTISNDETDLGTLSTLYSSYGNYKQVLEYLYITLRGNWKAIPSRLDINFSWDNMAGIDDIETVENNLSTIALGSVYYFSSSHSLGLTLSTIGYADQLVDANSYDEFVVNLQYGIQF